MTTTVTGAAVVPADVVVELLLVPVVEVEVESVLGEDDVELDEVGDVDVLDTPLVEALAVPDACAS